MKNIKLLTTIKKLTLIIALLISANVPVQSGNGYKNFQVAVYARAYEVRKMDSLQWLEPIWNEISRQVKVDKIYLETHRDQVLLQARYAKGSLDLENSISLNL
jgi:hypothetical protein